MRNHTLLFVNGRQHLIKGDDAFLTLSVFLRKTLKLCGTKIVCSEGDCGSCSVLCGRINTSGEAIHYLPIDSCIRFVFQLDGCHIITVEGLADGPSLNALPKQTQQNETLTSVQQAMIDCHGSQCGFCTPGFVVAMTGILEQNNNPSEEEWRSGLTGNLCRCTGYSPIVAAGRQAAAVSSPSMNQRYPAMQMADAVRSVGDDEVRVENESIDGETQVIASPRSLAQAIAFLQEFPGAKIISGGTDVGVQFNKGICSPSHWLDLSRVDELTDIEWKDQSIIAGASATWTNLEHLCKTTAPEFHKILSIFGSPQIRHVGTIGGNIINASPIADSLPFLMVCGAELELQSAGGTRIVNINDFYQDYKKFDLRRGELLTRIRIPMPPPTADLRLYKVSRRRDLDISTFTAAIQIERDGDLIVDSKIAYGAVGPVVLRLRKTESFLRGRSFSLESMREAGDIAVSEISPISDVRGGHEFRIQLARNVLAKFYYQTTSEGVSV
ncbi:FAD binding domain-containing protein [Rubripirellula amarantea]|nr:FAD binding domain-containing protein [Rubripirellula amarantea]